MSHIIDSFTQKKLIALNNEITSCRQCANVTYFSHNSIHQGKNNRILLIGESPAQNGWIITGNAWRDNNGKIVPSWRILQKLLDIIGLSLLDITFTEAAKCYPKERKMLKTCTKNCRPFLEKQISLLEPEIIITLWDHPTKSFLWDMYKKFSEVVGIPRIVEIKWKQYALLPIYHPSPVSPLSYKWNVEIFEKLKVILNK